MSVSNILLIVLSVTLVSGQRPSFAGSRPIGYPEVVKPTTEQNSLDNRFGEDIVTTTVRLPLEAKGDKDLVDRLSKLPKDQQPFWLLNWQALEEHRNNPQTFEQRPNVFVDPMPSNQQPTSSQSQQSQQSMQQAQQSIQQAQQPMKQTQQSMLQSQQNMQQLSQQSMAQFSQQASQQFSQQRYPQQAPQRFPSQQFTQQRDPSQQFTQQLYPSQQFVQQQRLPYPMAQPLSLESRFGTPVYRDHWHHTHY